MRIYSEDIGIKFGIEKYAMRKSRKPQMMEGTELPNQEKFRTLREKKTYKYLGILEADTIKEVEMKEKECLRRTRKLPETKLHSRNLINRINTWAVTLVRYSVPFLKWTREEPQQMDDACEMT